MPACAKCGYELSPFDTECPRCKRMAQTPCAVCGQIGASHACDECHKEVCDRCVEAAGSRTLCRTCASREQTARREPGAGVERGYVGPPVRGGWGFFDSVLRAFAFIAESVRMAFRDKDLILPSLLAILANGAFLGLVVLVLWSTGSLETFLSDDESAGGVAEAIVGAVVIFGSYLITYFFMAMTVHLVHVHLKGEDAQLGKAFTDALKNVHAIMALALVSTLVAILTNALRGRRGQRGIGDLVAGVIERLWTVATFLLLPIIILEDSGLRRALSRAKDIHRRGLMGIAVGEIAVGLVAGVLGFVGFLVAVLVGYGVFTALGIVAAIIIGGLLVATVFAFTQFVRTAYYTCLYEWAAAREELGEAAPVPAPLAPALA